MYEYLKSLHIIFVVCWFAGLFYVVRLFVYYAEAQLKPQLEKNILTQQYRLMIYRLWYIITFPSGVLATLFGCWMLFERPFLLTLPWMCVKLCFVFLLWLYHLKCQTYVNQTQKGTLTKSNTFFRIWNEGATIILFAVVFLVILKNEINWIFGVLGLLIFSILIMLGFKLYKKIREKNE